MTFFKNFKAQNNLQVILYLMGAEIFGFRQKLGPWRPFKDGNSHLLYSFATILFQTPITWVQNELFGDFQGCMFCCTFFFVNMTTILSDIDATFSSLGLGSHQVQVRTTTLTVFLIGSNLVHTLKIKIADALLAPSIRELLALRKYYIIIFHLQYYIFNLRIYYSIPIERII